MSASGSVSRLITGLKQGEAQAAEQLWQRYHQRLEGVARSRLHSSPRRSADEEDVVQQAFNSFFRGVRKVRYSQLDDRHDLWRLLVVITARKALDQLRHERSQRQGSGMVRGNSAIYPWEGFESGGVSEGPIGEDPSPEFAAQVTEEWHRLMGALRDENLQKVALWKMEGYTNEEVARLLGVSLRTIARKLDAIRVLWQKELPQ